MSNQLPIPAAYIKNFEQLGFGMFVYFGIYSKLTSGEWTYSMHKRNMDDYKKLADSFDVKSDSIKNLVATAKNAGCKYITLTTRHHDGFSLYDTKELNGFNALHSPTGRDLIKEFVEECRKADILPVFYHTTLDWYNEDFNQNFNKYLEYLKKSVELLCTNYGKIGGMWFDGNWSRPNDDWKEDELYSMIRQLQPEAMIINNTGLSKRGELGAAEIDSVTFERGMPHPIDRRGMKKYIAGEMCETICDHWGIADDINYKSVKQLIEELCECRKVGTNFLLNVGLAGDGSLPKMQEATMECIGRWMELFGKSIYNGRPCNTLSKGREFMLQDINDEKILYLFKFDLGKKGDDNVTVDFEDGNSVEFPNFNNEVGSIKWMDNGEKLAFKQQNGLLSVRPTGYIYGTSYCVRVAEVKLK